MIHILARQQARKRRWFAVLGACVLLWLIVSWFVAGQLMRRANDDLVAAARLSSTARAETIAKIMGQSIDNLIGIAAYIAREEDIGASLRRVPAAPAGWTLEQRKQAWSKSAALAPLHRHLSQAARHLGVDAIWIMNAQGDAIAASDMGSPASFVGTRYPDVVAFAKAPVVMARRGLPGMGLQVHVMERLPTLADDAGQQMQRFLPLAASGVLLLLVVGGSLIFALLRRQSERNLAVSLSLHQAIIESTSDGILVVDLSGHVTTHNQRFADLWQIPPSLLAQRNDRDLLAFVREQLRGTQGFMDKVEEIYRDPEEASFDLLEFRDGRVFERHSNPQRLGGKVVGRVWNFRDVTLRNRALEKLAQSELELQTIIDTEPECVKLIAADGTLLKMNRAGLEMIEADNPKRVIGKQVLGIIAAEYRAAFATLIERVFQGETGRLEFEIIGLKGGRRWLDTHAVPLRDPHGNIIALLGVTRDISEHRAAEADRAQL
ncbi:MAG: hypothetical protein COW48_04195, partial [Hydrogenophilales bacterium CG17_big_fil_post_rev_8_21_14_2_50_63_12]